MKSLLLLSYALPLTTAFIPPRPILPGLGINTVHDVSTSRIFLDKSDSSSTATVEKQDQIQLSISEKQPEKSLETPGRTISFLRRLKSRASLIFHKAKEEEIAEDPSPSKQTLGIFVPSQFNTQEIDPLTRKLQMIGTIDTKGIETNPVESAQNPETSEEKQLLQKIKDAGIAGGKDSLPTSLFLVQYIFYT
jgi:hypothetical protein